MFIGNYSFDLSLILGKGATGNVYQGKDLFNSGSRNQDQTNVAVKVINLNHNQN